MVAMGPPGLTIQLWVNDGSAGRAWYRRLFGRPPDFTPFSDDTFCEWIFKPGHWEIHVVERTTQRRGRRRCALGSKTSRPPVTRCSALASRLMTSKNYVVWCGGATSPILGATG